jgi:hypothetical protein
MSIENKNENENNDNIELDIEELNELELDNNKDLKEVYV